MQRNPCNRATRSPSPPLPPRPDPLQQETSSAARGMLRRPSSKLALSLCPERTEGATLSLRDSQPFRLRSSPHPSATLRTPGTDSRNPVRLQFPDSRCKFISSEPPEGPPKRALLVPFSRRADGRAERGTRSPVRDHTVGSGWVRVQLQGRQPLWDSPGQKLEPQGAYVAGQRGAPRPRRCYLNKGRRSHS